MGTQREKTYINLIYYPVYNLGPMKRVGVWFQGCTIHCKNCIAYDTWEFDNKYLMDLEFLIEKIISFPTRRITLSGGEPFDQPEVLYKLLLALRDNEFSDILVYSGYKYEILKKKWPKILSLIDVLIDGPFVSGLESDFLWKGSDNQGMYIISKNEGIINLYKKYYKEKKEKKLQFVDGKDGIILIGIPYQRDVSKIKEVVNSILGKKMRRKNGTYKEVSCMWKSESTRCFYM